MSTWLDCGTSCLVKHQSRCCYGGNFQMRLTFKSVDFDWSWLTYLMRVRLIQSVEGLRRLTSPNEEFCFQITFRLRIPKSFLPVSPAIGLPWTFWTCQLHNYVNQFLKINLSYCWFCFTKEPWLMHCTLLFFLYNVMISDFNWRVWTIYI